MLGFGFIRSGRDIWISPWISCSPLRRQQDWALLCTSPKSSHSSKSSWRNVGLENLPLFKRPLLNSFNVLRKTSISKLCLSGSEKPHRGDPSVQIPWIQGALVEFCLFGFPFPLLVYWQGRQYIGYSGTATGCWWYLAQQISNTPPKNGCGILFLPIW